MDRPRRSPKKKADPEFVYDSAEKSITVEVKSGTDEKSRRGSKKKPDTDKKKPDIDKKKPDTDKKGRKKKTENESEPEQKAEQVPASDPKTNVRATQKAIKSASPAHKRSRLSLKAAKEPKEMNKFAPIFSQPKEASTAPDMKPGGVSNAGSKTPTKNKDKDLVCVAALHNLGNTCFLNSILQILRHTPGFVENLYNLEKEIKISWGEMKLIAALEDDDARPIGSWGFVKEFRKLLKNMEEREKSVKKGQSKFIALRPYDFLHSIEELNPLFQGNLQQDAHECLRLILAHIQDAAKEVNKYRKGVREASVRALPDKQMHKEVTLCGDLDVQLPATVIDVVEPKGDSESASDIKQEIDVKQEPGTGGKDDDFSMNNICMDSDVKYESDSKSVTSVESVVLVEVPEERAVKIETKMDQTELPKIKEEANTNGNEQGKAKPRSKLSRTRRSAKNKEADDAINSSEAESSEVSAQQTGENGGGQAKRTRVSKKSGDPAGSDKNSMLKFLKPTGTGSNDVSENGSGDFVKSDDPSQKQNSGPRRGLKRKNVAQEPNITDSETMDSEDQVSSAGPTTTESSRDAAVCVRTKPGPRRRLGVRGAAVTFNNVPPAPPQESTSAGETKIKEETEAKPGTSVTFDCGEKELAKRPIVRLRKLYSSDLDKYHCTQKSMLEISRKTDAISDCVEQLFQGTMSHRTKCLECEGYNERKEEFQDISVPVKKRPHEQSKDEDDDDDKTDHPCAWFINAMEEVERLKDENKYHCERCDHLVEAERSMHYPVMPEVVTLHLKRFAMLDGYFGGFTKINEYVTTPLVLPSLQKVFSGDHRYELYGLVTHTGFSLSSGHYVTYVRAPPGHPSLPRSIPEPAPSASPPPEEAAQPTGLPAAYPVPDGDGDMADPNNNADTNNNLDTGSPNRNLETPESPVAGPSNAVSTGDSSDLEHYWFECDDDAVSVLSPSEFEKVLAPNASGTPYMLFYSKVVN